MKKLLLFVLCLAFGGLLLACGPTDNPDGPDNPGGDTDNRAWYEKDGDYTMNDFIADTSTLNWNPLSWETNDDSAMLAYQSIGFYDYAVNDDADNWKVVPEMAAALPTDVTASFVGRFGVQAGDKNKAWSIPLNRAATWSNGQKITSADYIYSMKQQLDPLQLNRRADSYYGGDFSIYNAKNYLYNGQFAYSSPIVSTAFGDEEYIDPATFLTDEEGFFYVEVNGEKKWLGVSLSNGGNWGSNGLVDYFNAGYLDANPAPYQTLKANVGKGHEGYSGWVGLNAETLRALQDCVAMLHDYADVEAYAAAKGDYAYKEFEEMAFFGVYNPEMSFDEVGLIAVDEYTIVVVLEKALQFPDFYLPYYLSSTWLVNEELYESCWQTNPDGSRVNNYMSSPKTSISYGPYKLESFEGDKKIKFTRNPEWYGYKDDKHKDKDGNYQYQTDNIVITVIKDHATALMAFESGDVDSVGLQAEDLKKYGSSQFILYEPQSYTTKFTIITDYDKLAERETETVNKRVLTNKNFRAAISYSMNRRDFTARFTAAAAPGYGLINYMYQVICEDGSELGYRNFDVSKEALVSLYGLEYGAGKDYADLDEAYAAITGYDMAKAKALMTQAYTEVTEAGILKDGQNVVITLSVYQADDIYKNMYEYVRGQIKEACVGTPFEGRVEVEMKVDADYYESAYAGKTDMIFSTWGGAVYGTLGLLSRVYCDDYTGGGNQMEVGFNTNGVPLTVEVAGVEYTATLKKFADWLNGDAEIEGLKAYHEYNEEVQVAVLAACEKAYLESFCAIPLYYRQSAILYSQKLKYPTTTYINLVGFGGLREIRYNYNDAEWAVAKKNLTY